jgi:PAS domain S-box-containing protein
MSPLVIFLAVACYFILLFSVAHIFRKDSPAILKVSQSPFVYSLSLAVYCTSWTYYGSVGRAASSGLSFLGVYLGPTIMVCLWWIILQRMVLIKDTYRITSIADFISARYRKSQGLAALVTLMVLIGNMPYIALQFEAVKSTFALLIKTNIAEKTWLIDHFGPLIVVIMTFFTVMFGARKLDPTERHRGMMTAIALESVVKLVVFSACGIYVTTLLFHDFSQDGFRSLLNNPAAANVFHLADGESGYITWTTLIILSMSAILFLPRQFHVAVVENSSRRNILSAMWQFPLYMLLINIFVIPIALYGIGSGIPIDSADTYVLNIPVLHGNLWLALFVFLGGFSAAMSMIIISAMTTSTMIVNHLLLPLFNLFRPLASMRRYLLGWRWIGILFICTVGYWFQVELGSSYALVNMGLISFAAVLQFAPAALGAVLWSAGSKAGAISGLVAGFIVWAYTLLLPAFIKSGLFSRTLLDNGPWGINFLRPEHLFGLTALPSLSHTVFWSLFFNIGAFVLVSLLFGQSEDERQIALEFKSISRRKTIMPPGHLEDDSIDILEKKTVLFSVLNEYFPSEKCEGILREHLERLSLGVRKRISIIEFAEFHRGIEIILAGSIGAAMAHRALNRENVFSKQERARRSKAYAEILSRLNVSPQELAEKINFYREREQLLTSHSQELEQRILEKEQEIEARIRAEKALKEAELQYRSIFDNALEGIFQISAAGKVLTANPAMATILGYKSPEVMIKEIRDIRAHFKMEPGHRDAFYQRLNSGKNVENFEIQMINATGRIIWLNLNARPTLDDRGQLKQFEGIAEDITKRKEAEKNLTHYHEKLEETVRLRTAEVIENQAFLQEVLEGILAAVIVIDRETQAILDCNSIAERLLGYDKETLINDKNALSRTNILEQESNGRLLNRELVIQRKNGEMVPVLRNMLFVVYKGILAQAIILFDITERKILERQVNMAQKLQSIGQLAAGIAHEINTPIQYIGSNISFLAESFNQLFETNNLYKALMDRARFGEDISREIEEVGQHIEELDLQFLLEEIPHAVSESLSGINQVSSIIKAMKQFAHPEQENLTQVDINKMLEQTATISKNEWKYVADLQLELERGIPEISGFPGPLNQVFLNLIINAAHAISEKMEKTGKKGRIVICTKVEHSAVVITVTDTGCGISEDMKQKIFDPLFTANTPGRGTGQGLSFAYSIIHEKHRGTLDVESKAGVGSTFTIRLPLSTLENSSILQ